MSAPDLSVVVPVHNNESTLAEQLSAVLESRSKASDVEVEIIVVDNRSTDGSRDIAVGVAGRYPNVRVVDAMERASEGYARNVGTRAASSRLLAFCDGDDHVGEGWVSAMARGLTDAEFVTGPVALDLLNPPWLAGVRGRASFEAVPLAGGVVPFAHGCNLGVRRELVDRLGGFDETMPAGMDIEFAIRAWRAGVQLVWQPEAVVHYRMRAQTGSRWRQATSYGRAQRALRPHLGDAVDARAERLARRRRVLWLLRTAPRNVSRAHRARWMWTLAVLVGSCQREVGRS